MIIIKGVRSTSAAARKLATPDVAKSAAVLVYERVGYARPRRSHEENLFAGEEARTTRSRVERLAAKQSRDHEAGKGGRCHHTGVAGTIACDRTNCRGTRTHELVGQTEARRRFERDPCTSEETEAPQPARCEKCGARRRLDQELLRQVIDCEDRPLVDTS